MPRKHFITAIIAMSALASSCGTGADSSGRVRNSVSKPTVLNGQFASNTPGWVGTGFTLGQGCAANSSTATQPSLGVWKKNSLAFGRRQSTVSQSIVVPEPSFVTFTITGAVRRDDLGGWFIVNLADSDEEVSTGRKSGTEASTALPYSLSVTTTAPNESITISLTGSGRNSWRGCYGPVMSNATVEAIPTVTSTATSVVTTSSSEQVDTSSTTCLITLGASTLEACRPFANYSIQFFSNSGPVSALRTVKRAGASTQATFRRDPRAVAAVVSLEFTDGSTVSDARITIESSLAVEAAPLPNTQSPPVSTTTTVIPTTSTSATTCRISYDGSTIRACKQFVSYSAQFFDNNQAVSGTYSGEVRNPITSVARPTEKGATSVQLSFAFADGSTINRQRVTIGQATDIPLATPATVPNTANSCDVSVYPNIVYACERVTGYEYQWWDESRATSGRLSSSPNTLFFYLGQPNSGSTRIRITLQFSNNRSAGPFFVPFDGKTSKSVTVPINKK